MPPKKSNGGGSSTKKTKTTTKSTSSNKPKNTKKTNNYASHAGGDWDEKLGLPPGSWEDGYDLCYPDGNPDLDD